MARLWENCASGSPDGTVFRMTTNGMLTTLVSFSLPDAAFPHGTMVLGSDGNLWHDYTGRRERLWNGFQNHDQRSMDYTCFLI